MTDDELQTLPNEAESDAVDCDEALDNDYPKTHNEKVRCAMYAIPRSLDYISRVLSRLEGLSRLLDATKGDLPNSILRVESGMALEFIKEIKFWIDDAFYNISDVFNNTAQYNSNAAMSIGVTVDGEPMTATKALIWANDETGVLDGTELLAEVLADAVHQEAGISERVMFENKRLKDLVKVVTAQAIVGVYMRGIVLLGQMDDEDRCKALEEHLQKCIPGRGYSRHEDELNGYESLPFDKALFQSLKEGTEFESQKAKLRNLLEGWIEQDCVGGRSDSHIKPGEFSLASNIT